MLILTILLGIFIFLLLSIVRSIYLCLFYKEHRERLKSLIGFKFVEQILVKKFEFTDHKYQTGYTIDKYIYYKNYENKLFEIRINGFILNNEQYISKILFKDILYIENIITNDRYECSLYSEYCLITYLFEFFVKNKINKLINDFKLIDDLENYLPVNPSRNSLSGRHVYMPFTSSNLFDEKLLKIHNERNRIIRSYKLANIVEE